MMLPLHFLPGGKYSFWWIARCGRSRSGCRPRKGGSTAQVLKLDWRSVVNQGVPSGDRLRCWGKHGVTSDWYRLAVRQFISNTTLETRWLC